MLGRPRIALALAVAASAAGLTACNGDGDGTIPPDRADALLAQLTQVEDAVERGDCTTAVTEAAQLYSAVDALPAEVGTETKGVLFSLVENLQTLTADQCEQTGATGETGFEPPPEEPTTPPPTAEEAPPEPEQGPPEDDGGNDGGNDGTDEGPDGGNGSEGTEGG
jgi:hypothetical protein